MKRIKAFFVGKYNAVVNFFKRFNLVNGWSNGLGSKQWDKFSLEIRISKLTLIDFRFDLSRNFRLILFNIGIEFK